MQRICSLSEELLSAYEGLFSMEAAVYVGSDWDVMSTWKVEVSCECVL
jgi:hypothetical protein